MSRQYKHRISKANNFVFSVPHVWVIASLENKMRENGNKNMLHFPHEQTTVISRKNLKKRLKKIYGKKRFLFQLYS